MAKIDVNEHELVPKHEKIEGEELEQVLEKYNVKKENLPKIERTDAALKDLDTTIEVGDVIKITRDSPTAGKAEYYRIVIEG